MWNTEFVSNSNITFSILEYNIWLSKYGNEAESNVALLS